MWKVIKFVIIFLTLPNRGVVGAPSYRIAEEEVRIMETLDHELCLSQGHDLMDNYSARLYWNCRLNLMDDRIKNQPKPGERNEFYVRELKRMRLVIKNYIERAESRINSDSQRIDRAIGDEKTEEEDSRLVLRKEEAYYYNLLQFFKYDLEVQVVNRAEEIEDILLTRKLLSKRNEIAAFRENLEKYPECARLNFNSREFASCLDFRTKVENCKRQALERIENLEYRNRFDCKRGAIVKYPDHMALYNSEYQELKNRKRDQFTLNKERDEAIERRLIELNTLMSGPRLSSSQLIDIRKFEEQKCNMQKMIENNVSRTLLIRECEKMLRQKGEAGQ
ncbi:MAG: hypothetical protein LBU15_01635 [Rickettsiales bacterium]|nr:hypothetical protein [Rickettsiales bacterium]